MQRKSFEGSQCPVARSLERVGEWWNILILRDAFYGMTRFDEFQKSLDIAPNMLTKRLNGLVAGGLLERRQYMDKPPRYEYVLTDIGRDFRPVLLAFLSWGNRHFAPEGISVMLADVHTGQGVDAVLVDASSGKPVNSRDYQLAAGPAANEGIRKRIAYAAEKRATPDKKPDFPPEAGNA
ncbi:MAG: helix-turn-helix domain-containing protein [Pseudomonadota bacterium]